MKSEKMLQEFEQKIGYTFQNKELLWQAFCHSSFINEKRIKRGKDNERLEFLGDAVLELVSSDYIFQNNSDMPEGKMTKLRASMVCEPALAYCARDLNLGDYLQLGKGEELTGGRERDSILSDALESVIGAVYLDGGFTNAKEFVDRFVLSDLDEKKLFYDSKTILQEIVQRDYEEPLSYELIKEEGPDHNKCFTVEARIGTKAIGNGSGRTKKAAEMEAAYQAILKIREKEDK